MGVRTTTLTNLSRAHPEQRHDQLQLDQQTQLMMDSMLIEGGREGERKETYWDLHLPPSSKANAKSVNGKV